MISIAMATFNGSEYLEEQVRSILNQTRLPDELVVVDDNSTDDTVSLLTEILKNSPVSLKLICNEINLGHQKSFDIAIQNCTGDVILLSDQDDYWLDGKIEYVENRFESDKNLVVLINDLDICGADLSKLGHTVISQTKNVGTYGRNGKGFIIGCATSFRSSITKLICPIPDVPYGHDKWIHEIATFSGGRSVYEKSLQLYRRHGSNSSSWAFDIPRKATWKDMIAPSKGKDLRITFINQLLVVLEIYKRFLCLSDNDLQASGIAASKKVILSNVSSALNSITARIQLLGSSGIFAKLLSLKMLMLNHYSYFLGWRSFAKDFFLRG